MKSIKRETKRKLIHYGSIVLLIGVLFLIGVFFLDKWDQNQGYYGNETPPSSQTSIAEIIYNGDTYVFRDNLETVLVVGVDTYEDESKLESYDNADFLMLLVLDNEKKECTALQINRDTMTPVNVLGVAGDRLSTETMQIALAHSYGSGVKGLRNTCDAVSTLLSDVNIDCSVSVTMDAVAILNDKVDGVEVKILDDFSAIDPALVKDETITLSGEQALTYVQSRGGVGDQTNQSRMERQRQYLGALFDKVKENAATSDQFVADCAIELSDYFVSRSSNDELTEVFEKVTDYTFAGIKTLEGQFNDDGQYMEFYPDGIALTGLVCELFCEKK